MKITVNNTLRVEGAPPALSAQIRGILTIRNLAWAEAERMGRWTGNIPEFLKYYQEKEGVMTLPRGFCRQLIGLCRSMGVPLQIIDQRRTLELVDFHFEGTLKPFQQEAAGQVLKRDFGLLCLPTGGGKTVASLYIISERKQPALIVVHSKELLNQWIDRIGSFLGIPESEIGVIGNGQKRIGEHITVALVQSLYKCADQVAPHIGFLIVDECHRAPSRTFTEAVMAFNSRYMLGLSATPYRRDGLSKLIFWHLGDLVYQVDTGQLVEDGHVLRAEVITRETDFDTCLDASEQYSRVLSELCQDLDRNLQICQDVADESRNGGGICLVLSDRKSHCETLRTILSEYYSLKSDVLTGDLPKKHREAVVDRLNAGEVKVLVATGQLVGEGFDCAGLSTLFLATPIKFDGRLLQYLGRILRPSPGKQAKVFDYVDVNVGVLKASAKARRRRVYSQWK
jgi:superfamily II DNA or RNA helicase